ncbi:MAG: Gfo/Idh/MocA family oxidoreductase [Planctomycetia bacterium]|nr:Gfo/Idh/MocA family oxidoreductase [Planctomycetia bacterium]
MTGISATPASTTRREFLKTSAVGVAAAAIPHVHAAGSDVLRIGLVGCGGRGTGAGAQAGNADPNVKLVALADMFPDHLERAHKILQKELKDKFDVPKERCFTGFDAYKQLIDCGVDVVVLASPPHFRPAHIKYAVEKGKHIFAEKPCAVDAPGVRAVLAAAEEAKKKNLAIVSGLCWRYDTGKRETMKQVHDGTVGDIVALQCSYNTGPLWSRERQPNWSDMEWQLRNWLYFTWLSGDFNVEQHIHSLDKMMWAMKDEPPVKAVGLGGRQVRTDPRFGHIFDHHSVVYEWGNGVKLFANCRQMANCVNDVTDHVMGTKANCDVMKHTIHVNGKPVWKFQGPPGVNMYQNEHNELFASIRQGKPINDGEWMAKSTLLAIMGRMATYTGQQITWQQALSSKENLTPAKYEFGPLSVPDVARPGITKFV